MYNIYHTSDPHLSADEQGNMVKPMNQRRWSLGVPAYEGYIQKLIDASKQIGPDDFLCITGDLVHDMSRTTAPLSLHWMDDNLGGEGIIVVCTGNHDRSIDFAKIRLKHRFKRLFMIAIGEILTIGPYVFGCYSDHDRAKIAKGKVGGGMPEEDETDDWYSNKTEDLMKFAEQLAEYGKKHNKVPVLMSHYPPSEMQNALGSLGIKAYLHGHVHCTNNKVEGGVDWQWYNRACAHTDDKTFNGMYVSCGTTDVQLARTGKIMKQIPINSSVSENFALKRKNQRDAAAQEMGCHPGMAKPFSRQDPFNPDNSLTGFICVQKGPMQGSLYLTHVNGEATTPQLIYGVPKMRLPYKGKTEELEIAHATKYVFMKKWNGMNVLFFKYRNKNGRIFISAKSKGAPLLSDSEYGNFLSLTLEVLNRDPLMGIISNHLGADDNQSISFELCGTKEPHLVKYDFDIALKPLFHTNQHGKIKPWLSMVAKKESFIRTDLSEVDALQAIKDMKHLDFITNQSFRDVHGLTVKYEYNHFAREGYVMYPVNENLEVVSRGQITKIKPKDIEEVHWQQFDGQMEGRVQEALVKLKDQGLPPTAENLQEELDMGPKEWSKFGRKIMTAMGSVETRSNEVLILVGLPGSGKSTYAKELELQGYVRVNQDELGSANSCKERMALALVQGRKVVVDRTNINVQQRRRWIDLAKKHGVTNIRCMLFDTPATVCIDRVVSRKGHPTINDSVPEGARAGIVTGFLRSYEEPKLEEGFANLEKRTYVES